MDEARLDRLKNPLTRRAVEEARTDEEEEERRVFSVAGC